jgi:hypothetical protein
MTAVFKSFWHGGLSLLHKACLQSFIRHGHEFRLYSYHPQDAGPGVIICDANEIVRESEIFYVRDRNTGSPDIAPFSDFFRLKLLRDGGGWWCDVDTVCLTAAVPAAPLAWSRGCVALKPNTVFNGIMASPANQPFIAEMYRRAKRLRPNVTSREQLGSELLSGMIEEFGLPADIGGTPETFYPLGWVEIFKLWLPDYAPEVRGKTAGAVFLPLCGSIPQLIGIDMSVLPPGGSYLDEMLRRFAPEHAGAGPRYSRDEIIAMTGEWVRKYRVWAVPDLLKVAGPTVLDVLGLGAEAAAQRR